MTLSPAQLARRIEGVGGSEALAYCGKDPRCSPVQLYLRKIGEAGETPESDARQDWGHRLEPVVREWLAEELGSKIIVPPETIVSEAFPFMFGNFDGIVFGNDLDRAEGVEIKTGDKFTAAEFGEVGTDEVPVRYVLQCMHYMIVGKLKRFHLGALLGGNDARHYVIDYDAELAELLIARATAFWAFVQARTPPEPTTLHDADKLWPSSGERTVSASSAIVLAIARIKEHRAAEKAAGELADDAELTLKVFMGDADTLTDAAGRRLASWKSQSRESLDTKALIEAHPELAAQYRRVSNFRVFRLK
jgi:predicted phage-related endonuclease